MRTANKMAWLPTGTKNRCVPDADVHLGLKLSRWPMQCSWGSAQVQLSHHHAQTLNHNFGSRDYCDAATSWVRK